VVLAVVPGGIRYRDSLKEMSISTDQDGKFTVTFPDPGMYWISATVRTGPSGEAVADPPVAEAPAGTEAQPPFRAGERAIYAATLEVMAK
jgi:hypothetical protein